MIDIPSDLLMHLQSEHNRAFDPALMEQRKIAVEFYKGLPFGDEMDGRSQLVTRDVAEVVDYMTVSVTRTMISDKVVEFEARRQEDVQAASDATELVAWQFMREQPGLSIIRDALVSGLLEKTGVFKTWVEEETKTVEAYTTDISAPDIIAAEDTGEFDADPTTGEVLPVYRVLREVKEQEFRDAAVPNEEFGFNPEARSLDEADYIVHRTRYTIQELAEHFGIPMEEASGFGDDVGEGKGLSDARDSSRSYKDSDETGFGRSRRVWVEEEYLRWDWNGDGYCERIRVQRIGAKVISVQPVDEQPFVIWCPFPMPHRIVGDSLADKVMDIQRIRSMLLRAAMDALYFANAPRSLVSTDNMDPNTIDDLLSIVPGAPIRYSGQAPQPWMMPFAAPQAFTALEFMSGERESRTGITRHNQGLNPDTLNKTATGMAMLQASGAQMEEYVARNFAEALAELFEKKLRLMRKYGKVSDLRIGGEFKTVDASSINGDMDMAIRVGLGTGKKDQRLQYRMMVLDMQKQAKDVGSPLVDDKKLYNSAEGIVADAGLGDVNNFFNDPETVEPSEPKPKEDPAVIEAKGKLDMEAQRQQFEQQKAAAALDLEHQRGMAKMQVEREQSDLQMQLMRDKAAAEADLANRKFEFERDLAERKMLAELALRERMTAPDTIPENRMGGRLDV